MRLWVAELRKTNERLEKDQKDSENVILDLRTQLYETDRTLLEVQKKY